MATELQELHKRVAKIEQEKDQEILTLVEILSNATFFGEIKKTTCKYSNKGQCSFYILEPEAKNKIPIATDCRLPSCKSLGHHCHLELSNIACALCQNKDGSDTTSYLREKSNQE